MRKSEEIWVKLGSLCDKCDFLPRIRSENERKSEENHFYVTFAEKGELNDQFPTDFFGN